MTNYTELKRLAERASLATPWYYLGDLLTETIDDSGDAAYIAAASPDVVLGLIKSLEHAQMAAEAEAKEVDERNAVIDKLRTQNQALREALKRAKPFVEGREYECEAQYDTSKDGAHYDAFATARDIREQCDVALAQAEGGV